MHTRSIRMSRWLAPMAAASLWLASGPARADVAPDPPAVQITSPADGAMLMGDPAVFDVMLDVWTGDMGIDRIDLTLDGEVVASSDADPWSFTGIEAGAGMHTLVATAVESGTGTAYPSTPITIAVVGEAATGDGTTGSGEGTGSDDSADTGATGSGPPPGDEPSDDDPEGCGGCTTRERRGLSGSAMLLGLVLMGLGRRRRRS